VLCLKPAEIPLSRVIAHAFAARCSLLLSTTSFHRFFSVANPYFFERAIHFQNANHMISCWAALPSSYCTYMTSGCSHTFLICRDLLGGTRPTTSDVDGHHFSMLVRLSGRLSLLNCLHASVAYEGWLLRKSASIKAIDAGIR